MISYYAVPGLPVNSDPQINNIITIVCCYLSVDEKAVKGRSRKAKLVEARNIIWYFLRKIKKYHFSLIGRIFSKDHTSILYGVRSVEKFMKVEYGYREMIEEISIKISYS